MQIFKILSLLAVAFTGAVYSAPTGTGNCQELGENGAMIDSGNAYFQCRDGKLFPIGCLTADQKRVEIGQTADVQQIRYQCSLQGDKPTLTVKSCVFQGGEHAVGEQFQDQKSVYTCQKDGDSLSVKVSGCVDDAGKRVNVNDKSTTGDLVMSCVSQNGNNPRLVASGCVKNGRQVDKGESLEDGDTLYNCTRTGMKPAGCVNQGRRLNEGDRFFDKDVVMECNVDNDKVSIRATGCIQHNTDGQNIERRLGCFWVEGQEPFQYEWTCKYDKTAQTAVKVQTKCNYRVQKGVYDIEPGCYRTIDGAAFGCLKSTGDQLQLQSFQGTDMEKAAVAAGLHAC
jgi:hypothetical protein